MHLKRIVEKHTFAGSVAGLQSDRLFRMHLIDNRNTAYPVFFIIKD